MSTSEFGMTIPFAGGLYGDADDPLDTVIVRDGIVNGLLHCADSFAQVRCNLVPIRAAVAGASDPFFTLDTPSVAANTWYEFRCGPLGTWPLTVHASGAPYVLRVRLAVAASSTDGSVTHDFRIVLSPDGRGAEERDRTVDHVFGASLTASTSIVWASGTSQGSASSATLLTLDAATARGWTRRVSVSNGVSAGNPGSVEQLLVSATVYGRTSSASVTPRLHGVHLAEYVGL